MNRISVLLFLVFNFFTAQAQDTVFIQKNTNTDFTYKSSNFTIPATGTYRITVKGAAGGNGSYKDYSNKLVAISGGQGAVIVGQYDFTAGQILVCVSGATGQTSTQGGGGGGGGSGVLIQGASSPLFVAGGGGGGGGGGANGFGFGGGVGGNGTTTYICCQTGGYGGNSNYTQTSGGGGASYAYNGATNGNFNVTIPGCTNCIVHLNIGGGVSYYYPYNSDNGGKNNIGNGGSGGGGMGGGGAGNTFFYLNDGIYDGIGGGGGGGGYGGGNAGDHYNSSTGGYPFGGTYVGLNNGSGQVIIEHLPSWNFNAPSATTIAISTTVKAVNTPVFPQGSLTYYTTGTGDTLSTFANARLQLNATPIGNYYHAAAGDTFTISLRSNNAGGLKHTGTNRFAQIGTVADTTAFPNTLSANVSPASTTVITHGTSPYDIQWTDNFKVVFPLGSKRGFVVLRCQDTTSSNIKNYYSIVMPFIVDGNLNDTVPILGTYTEPQMPFTILHPPPGNGSYTQLSATKKTCRSLQQTYTQANNTSLNAYAKLGVSGSAGLFVTLNFDIHVQFDVGYSGGTSTVSMSSSETCLTSNQTYSAAVGTGDIRDSSDLFVGYGYNVNWGIYDTIGVVGGVVKQSKGMVVAPVLPVSGFTKTLYDIQKDIASLQSIVNNAGSSDKVRADAQNQINVWNQLLALNTANKANASVPYPNAVSGFTGGQNATNPIPAFTDSEAISVTNTNSIQAEHYITKTGGIEAVIDIGGSGVGASSEFKTSYNWGATNSQTQSTDKQITYALLDPDNDPNTQGHDVFKFGTLYDPMFGTPVFKLDSINSKTSCPYEGGIQRDQPVLKISGTTADSVTISKASPDPNVGTILKLDICNNSNESRIYNLGVNNNNLSGINITAGAQLSGATALLQPFGPIAAHGCLMNQTVNIKRSSPLSNILYPNLEFDLYSDCQQSIYSSAFATVNFNAPILLNAKAFLQGPYNSSTGLMNDALRSLADFPLVSPYGTPDTIKKTSILTGTTSPTAVVDWVKLELRDANSPSTVLFSRSALLLRNGSVVDTDGVSPVAFYNVPSPVPNYYVTIKHRNHLGVRSLNTLTFAYNTPTNFNFNADPINGTNALKSISGTYPTNVMWAGDANGDGKIIYNGAGNDKNVILGKVGLTTPNKILSGYYNADLNLDGKVIYNGASNDKNIILGNVGLATPNNIIIQQ